MVSLFPRFATAGPVSVLLPFCLHPCAFFSSSTSLAFSKWILSLLMFFLSGCKEAVASERTSSVSVRGVASLLVFAKLAKRAAAIFNTALEHSSATARIERVHERVRVREILCSPYRPSLSSWGLQCARHWRLSLLVLACETFCREADDFSGNA